MMWALVELNNWVQVDELSWRSHSGHAHNVRSPSPGQMVPLPLLMPTPPTCKDDESLPHVVPIPSSGLLLWTVSINLQWRPVWRWQEDVHTDNLLLSTSSLFPSSVTHKPVNFILKSPMNTHLCTYFPTNSFALSIYYLGKILDHFSISLIRNKVPILSKKHEWK